MGCWFGTERFRGFTLFSWEHGIPVLVLAGLLMWLPYVRRKSRGRRLDRAWRLGLTLVLVASEASIHTWYLWNDRWSLQYGLPLQLCSVCMLLSAVMLWVNHPLADGFLFYAGTAGAVIAMLSPDLRYGFPHFRYFEFFISHVAVIAACLWKTAGGEYRPTFRAVWTSLLLLNGLALIAYVVNGMTGGNYLFLSRKPNQETLLDLLGPNPVIAMEGIALTAFLLMWSVLYVVRRRKNKNKAG